MYTKSFSKILHLGTKILTGRTLVNDRTAQDRLVIINIFIIYLQKYPEKHKIFEKTKLILKVNNILLTHISRNMIDFNFK